MIAQPWPFGWRAGMRLEASEKGTDPGEIVGAVDVDGLLWLNGDWEDPAEIEAWPDFTDAGTRGHVLELVREKHKAPRACLVPHQGNRWAVRIPSPLRPLPKFVARTEGGALLLALEAEA